MYKWIGVNGMGGEGYSRGEGMKGVEESGEECVGKGYGYD